MIKGANDSERVKNAFLSELQALAQQPTSTQIRMGGLAVMDTVKTCQSVALDTTIALNRDVQHQCLWIRPYKDESININRMVMS